MLPTTTTTQGPFTTFHIVVQHEQGTGNSTKQKNEAKRNVKHHYRSSESNDIREKRNGHFRVWVSVRCCMEYKAIKFLFQASHAVIEFNAPPNHRYFQYIKNWFHLITFANVIYCFIEYMQCIIYMVRMVRHYEDMECSNLCWIIAIHSKCTLKQFWIFIIICTTHWSVCEV